MNAFANEQECINFVKKYNIPESIGPKVYIQNIHFPKRFLKENNIPYTICKDYKEADTLILSNIDHIVSYIEWKDKSIFSCGYATDIWDKYEIRPYLSNQSIKTLEILKINNGNYITPGQFYYYCAEFLPDFQNKESFENVMFGILNEDKAQINMSCRLLLSHNFIPYIIPMLKYIDKIFHKISRISEYNIHTQYFLYEVIMPLRNLSRSLVGRNLNKNYSAITTYCNLSNFSHFIAYRYLSGIPYPIYDYYKDLIDFEASNELILPDSLLQKYNITENTYCLNRDGMYK